MIAWSDPRHTAVSPHRGHVIEIGAVRISFLIYGQRLSGRLVRKWETFSQMG